MLSAIVSALLCIQLGSGPEVESLFSTIKSLLVAMVQDGALQSQMRASVLIESLLNFLFWTFSSRFSAQTHWD